MSTKTKTTTPKAAPKKGTVAHNSNRIDELEGILKGVEFSGEEILPVNRETAKKYLATGRASFPPIGGLALPAGIGFHAFVDLEFEDATDADGALYPPSRENVTERLQELADKQYPLNVGVVLCDISVLPAGW